MPYDSFQSPQSRAMACCFTRQAFEYLTQYPLKAKMDTTRDGTNVSLSLRIMPRIRRPRYFAVHWTCTHFGCKERQVCDCTTFEILNCPVLDISRDHTCQWHPCLHITLYLKFLSE